MNNGRLPFAKQMSVWPSKEMTGGWHCVRYNVTQEVPSLDERKIIFNEEKHQSFYGPRTVKEWTVTLALREESVRVHLRWEFTQHHWDRPGLQLRSSLIKHSVAKLPKPTTFVFLLGKLSVRKSWPLVERQQLLSSYEQLGGTEEETQGRLRATSLWSRSHGWSSPEACPHTQDVAIKDPLRVEPPLITTVPILN